MSRKWHTDLECAGGMWLIGLCLISVTWWWWGIVVPVGGNLFSSSLPPSGVDEVRDHINGVCPAILLILLPCLAHIQLYNSTLIALLLSLYHQRADTTLKKGSRLVLLHLFDFCLCGSAVIKFMHVIECHCASIRSGDDLKCKYPDDPFLPAWAGWLLVIKICVFVCVFSTVYSTFFVLCVWLHFYWPKFV